MREANFSFFSLGSSVVDVIERGYLVHDAGGRGKRIACNGAPWKIHYRVFASNETWVELGVWVGGEKLLHDHQGELPGLPFRHRTFINWLKSKPIRFDFQIEFDCT